jgi:TrwC relaxase
VAAENLRALIDRLDPKSGAPCGRRRPRVRAFDATFSTPKSLSLLHARWSPTSSAQALGSA